MICPSCQHDVHPKIVFDLGGVVEKCPRDECAATLSQPKIEAQEPAAPAQPTKPARKAPTKSEPLDVLKLAKTRLTYVSRQVKKLSKELKTLQAEETKLKRLLKAAESPVAAVTPIRRQGS